MDRHRTCHAGASTIAIAFCMINRKTNTITLQLPFVHTILRFTHTHTHANATSVSLGWLRHVFTVHCAAHIDTRSDTNIILYVVADKRTNEWKWKNYYTNHNFGRSSVQWMCFSRLVLYPHIRLFKAVSFTSIPTLECQLMRIPKAIHSLYWLHWEESKNKIKKGQEKMERKAHEHRSRQKANTKSIQLDTSNDFCGVLFSFSIYLGHAMWYDVCHPVRL